MSKQYFASAGWSAIASLLVCLGCSADKSTSVGGLVVSITTDLDIPKDLTHLALWVVREDDSEVYRAQYPLGGNRAQTRLPATLVLEPGDSDELVNVRVYGRQETAIVSMTEAIVDVPRDRTAILRMPIEWLSLGMVEIETDEGEGGAAASTGNVDLASVVSECGKGRTPKAGTCVASEVDSTKLPGYAPSKIFGGGTGEGDGTCFDVEGCFEEPQTVSIVDSGACLGVVSEIADIAYFSIGLRTADGSGFCGANGCVVPLDSAMSEPSASGWTVDQDGIQLPPAVCAGLADGSIDEVVATAQCLAKTAATPTCGSFSNVGSSNGQGGAGVSRYPGPIGRD